MAADISNKMDFQDYKRLTVEEREFFVFTQLCKIDDFANSGRYASKWVEHAMKGAVGIVLTGFVAGLVALVQGGGPK